jgi:hypothetical protein
LLSAESHEGHPYEEQPSPLHATLIGPYFAIGGTAYVFRNELKGDDSVKVEDTGDADNNDNTNDQVELDVERAKVDNDIDFFYEGGLIGNFTKGASSTSRASPPRSSC